MEFFNGEERKKARKEKNTTKKEKILLLNKDMDVMINLVDNIITIPIFDGQGDV